MDVTATLYRSPDMWVEEPVLNTWPQALIIWFVCLVVIPAVMAFYLGTKPEPAPILKPTTWTQVGSLSCGTDDAACGSAEVQP